MHPLNGALSSKRESVISRIKRLLILRYCLGHSAFMRWPMPAAGTTSQSFESVIERSGHCVESGGGGVFWVVCGRWWGQARGQGGWRVVFVARVTLGALLAEVCCTDPT